MAHVITGSCCKDGACVDVCPPACIHPGPEMFYIDPGACIDCGACVTVCPVNAIYHEDDLPGRFSEFREVNLLGVEDARKDAPVGSTSPSPVLDAVAGRRTAPLRVAVVGSGPSGMFAAREILVRCPGSTVTVLDREPVPWGLLRFGVAPDHLDTKDMARRFRATAGLPGVEFALNVQVGRDVTHAELVEGFDAVIYAVGASNDRKLGIPGEELSGVASAREFVAWYNGHPEMADRHFDLSCDRVVIVGCGNVALDSARILLTDAHQLEKSDIAPHALEVLRTSCVREVVIIARRGPAYAAATIAELLSLRQRPDIDLFTNSAVADGAQDTLTRMEQYKADFFSALPTVRPSAADSRRIGFYFGWTPECIVGSVRAEGLVAQPTISGIDAEVASRPLSLSAGLALKSVGLRSTPVPGLPFDEQAGIISNVRGRVTDAGGSPVARTYVVGWAKRGPSGVIGSNRECAAETVDSILADHAATTPDRPRVEPGIRDLLEKRGGTVIDYEGWKVIDMTERQRGMTTGRPRVKLVSRADLVATARGDS